MPKALKDLPRPSKDNGRGLHGSANTGWSGGGEGYDYWVNELVEMGIKWFKVLDDHGDSLALCEKLLAAGIFPIVRIVRRDPPPNDVPEPNPGHISPAEEDTVKRLVAIGVRYFETNNEPDLAREWKHNAMPGDVAEAAKLVALNWLFDARLILEAGGFPGLPAISIGGTMDLMGALVSLGRQEILTEGCWIAIHNSSLNRPLGYPDDPVNRTGIALTNEQYDLGRYTSWAWWNSELGCVDSIEALNQERGEKKSPTQTILQDHACFREFEYYHHLAIKYLGHSLPIISTQGGLAIGRRQDPRYPRVTPEMHRDQTVALFDFMQRQAPDYYFAATPWLLLNSVGHEMDAWTSPFWPRALRNGTDSRNGIPPIAVQGIDLGDRLPVIDAVKAMPKLTRRLPGAQPAPPGSAKKPTPPPPPEQPTIVIPVPSPSRPATYTVQPGDTLWKIAERFGSTWKALAAFNRIQDPGLIRPGLVLSIPPNNWSAPSTQAEVVQTPVFTPAAPSEGVHPSDELHPSRQPHPSVEPRPLELPEKEPDQPEKMEEPLFAPPAPTFPPPVISAPPEKMAPPITPTLRPPLEPPPELPTPLYSEALKPPLDWDPRLDALNITLEELPVEPGQEYWRLIRAEYLSMEEANGKHHINYILLDEQGKPVPLQRVWQGWPEDRTDATTNEQGEATIPIWASYAPDRQESGPYVAWVDGLPSDCVQGIGLPFKRQVSFVLTWQRVVS